MMKYPSIQALERLSPEDVGAVLTHARTLQRAALAGATQALLRGKNLGLLCKAEADGGQDGDAALFRRAAMELGAHVAHIRPSLSELSTPQEVQHTARMLGRLYDAVECQGMDPSLVQQVALAAGVPVYDGIASQGHPTARLSNLLDGGATSADKRRFVLQAVLLSTIA
ncbi:MAG: ornithine carbamoyltransferase [Burkholderiales bacterium]|nr:ornithine carbamoyltransferase [Burkholderiales bacterium]